MSASGSAANTDSMAPGPRSFSRATAFWVAGLAGSVQDLISVISRSARKLVKKLIQPFRKATPAPLPRASAPITLIRHVGAEALTHPAAGLRASLRPVGNAEIMP